LNRGKPKKRLDSAKKENLEPPPKEIWVLEKPNISALQDDIIKLSAQFVARNGRAFQSGLLEREHKNSQFGFLQPYHPLHQYFKKLVTDYTRILLPERGTVERLQELASDKQAIINSVMKKAHWEKAQKKTEEEKRKEEEAERNAMALIDWHDFTVVQTIEWDDEEEEDIEEEGPNEPEPIPPPPQPTLPPKPAVEPAPQQPLPKASNVNQEESDDMDVGEDDEFSQEAQRTDLPVRHDYNPRDVRASGNTTLKYITPSGQQIYPAEAEITMRIELSNSKVIEQRKAEAMNERDSNLAEGEEISRHLKNFVKNRNDIFGDELGLPEEPKKPVIEKPTWDGHSSSIQRVAMEALNGVNMQQIKALHDSKIYSGELSEPTIGPKLATTTRTPNATITTRPPEPARPQPPAPPRPQPIIPPSYSGTLPPFQPPMIRPPFPIQLPSHFNPPRLVPPMMTTMPPIPKEDAEEPPMKRAKIKEKKDEITKNLISEKEFLDTHPGSVNIVIKVPNQPPGSTKWPSHLNGQTYRVQVNTSDNIKTLKQKLADLLGMPANKQKLRAEGLGFLKDAKTLAFYNATDNIEVELGVKERGGRKK
jgi:splicing factor 3A subunit 1